MGEMKTKRLRLRPVRMEDTEAIHCYAGSEEVTRYMIWGPNDYAETAGFVEGCVEEAAKEDPAFYEFVIQLEERVIGGIGLHLSHDREEAEIGWISLPAVWGNGYMTEAAEAVRDFAFHVLRLRRITAHCDTRNIASFRVMEKIGMCRTAEIRQSRRDKKSDTYIFDEYTYHLRNKKEK